MTVSAFVVIAGCSSSGKTASHGPGPCIAVKGDAATVVTKNSDFSPDCLVLKGSTLKVTYENLESGIPHNFHLKGVKGVGGSSATEVKPGKNTQSIEYEGLKPGTYTYVCDIHTNMVGELKVTN